MKGNRPTSNEGWVFIFMKRKIVAISGLIIGLGCFYPWWGWSESPKIPPRIISLCPSNTEILFALGLDKEIVGVTQQCNYPLTAIKKEKIGSFSSPNLERIVFLKPDLVLSTGIEQGTINRKLKDLQLPVVIIDDPKNFTELFQSLEKVGQATGRKRKAEQVIGQMKKKIALIKGKNNRLKYRPRVFIEINLVPLMTASKDSFLNEIITLAGGENTGRGLPRSYCQVSEEWIIKQDPEIIILTSPLKKKEFMIKHRWEKVSAFKKQTIYDSIDPDILMRPTPRIVEGLEALSKIIHSYMDYK